MKKTLVSLAIASLFGLVSASASAIGTFEEFTVDESSVPDAAANTFVADKLNGGYNEVLTVNVGGTFDTAAYADWGQYFKNDGATLVASQLNNFGTAGYGLYATFSSSGVLTASGFNGTTGSFNLYIDPLQDTTKTLPGSGSGSVVLGNTSDDYQIAFATDMIKGLGLVGTPGAFDFIWDDFTLTNGDQNAGTTGTQNGDLYFTQPRPFHLKIDSNGDFDAFPNVPGPGTYTGVTGDVSAVFIPEPGSLALLGLGLFGLAMSRRRKA